MKDEQTRHELVRYWFDKSGAALAAARREHAAGDLALGHNPSVSSQLEQIPNHAIH